MFCLEFFYDRISYTNKSAVTRILQLSQHNGKLPLPWLKQGNYPVIPIYVPDNPGSLATDIKWRLLFTHIYSITTNDYPPVK